MKPKLTLIPGGVNVRLESLDREWTPAAGRSAVEFELNDAELADLAAAIDAVTHPDAPERTP